MLISVCILWITAFQTPPEPLTTDNMAQVVTLVHGKAEAYGSAEVLVVFDIDNTLLAMNQDFGSDQWFSWQYQLLNDDSTQDGQMADSMAELLKLQRELFALSAMHLTESGNADIVRNIQERGHPVIALTSRGPANRVPTERELSRQGLDLSATAFGSDIAGTFSFSDDELTDFGKELLDEYRFPKPMRPVSYDRGIYMVEGQHKGAALVLLMQRFRRHFKAVIMIDDHAQNCSRVATALFQTYNQNASKEDDIDITTFIYTAEKPQVDAFFKSDKQAVLDAWSDYQKMRSHLK